MVNRDHISFWNWVALHRDDQDALAAAAFDQFAQEDAYFDGFSQAGRIRHENALSRLIESLQGGVELEGQIVYGRPVADPQVRIGGR
jgi:hypothetical protein